jgi:hypothetical protein
MDAERFGSPVAVEPLDRVLTTVAGEVAEWRSIIARVVPM